MSEHKLTLEGIAKIKSVADGNGMETSKVELLGSEEQTLTVHAQMSLKLDMGRETASYPGSFKNLKNLPKGRAEKITNEKDIEEKIKELKTKAETGGYWSKDAARQLKAETGHGWGLEKADVILDSLTQTYYSDVQCTSCNGSSYIACGGCQATGQVPCMLCQQSGLETCTGCNGTGLNSAYPDQYCSYCNGNRQVYCRECRGQRQSVCIHCKGQGRNKCTTCGGNGLFTTEINIMPTAKAEFTITQSADLPGGFRKAIARAGLKTLAKGHATIAIQELANKENGEPYIPYTAVMPYAEMRVRINGKPMKCVLLGHKCVILDLPNFIDTAMEDKITQFEANMKSPDVLAKALELRVCREAFGLLQLKNADARMLRQLYPTGMSIEMAQRILDVMRKLVHGQTIIARIIAAVVSVLLFVAIDYGIIASGVRLILMAKLKPISVLGFDIALCVGGYFLQNYLLRLVAAKKLQSHLGGNEKVVTQSAGGVGVIAGIAVVLLYMAMLLILKAVPSWQFIFAHPFG
mgnify:CR=1 FL=1